MTIDPTMAVAQIATEHPRSTRVFGRHGLDFCCGGHEPLAETCASLGLDLAELLAELEAELATGDEPDGAWRRWDAAPLAELVKHIVAAYHDPLREELPRLEHLARKVHRVHGDKDPAMFEGILATFLAIQADIVAHLDVEEQVLFPALLAGAPGGATMVEIEAEHEQLGQLLRDLRSFARDYVVPDEACGSWRGLLTGLEELEAETHRHIHLENHVLHPRARAAG